MYKVEGEIFSSIIGIVHIYGFVQWMYDAPTVLTVPLFRMYSVATMSCYPCRNISKILFRYLLQVTRMEPWVIKQWHQSGSTLFRQLEQFPPHVVIWAGTESERLLGTYFSFLKLQLINTLIWTRCKTVSCRNLKTLVWRTIPALNRAGNRHITHSLLGNTLVWFSGNFSIAMGHQCC